MTSRREREAERDSRRPALTGHACVALWVAAMAGCSVVSSSPTELPASPAATAPPSPAPSSSPAASPAVPPPASRAGATDESARYERVAFDALPATADSDWLAAWPAYLQTCQALAQRDPWKPSCARALGVERSAGTIRRFFSQHFDTYRLQTVVGAGSGKSAAEATDRGLVTGYYEPLLKGSRRLSSRYRVPLYRVPDDLIAIDLAGVHPELASFRLRGRLEGKRVVPYPSRGEITSGNLLRGAELLWVDDPIEAFFLQVQGSGRVQLDDGTTVRVGYGDTNGHPYRSIGRWLVEQRELSLDQVSMQGIKAWAEKNPRRLDELLTQNPSFVFFREVPLGDPGAGPKGALNVPLTPRASIAVDPRFVPLGAPLLLSTIDPMSGAPLVRPVLAQDTGSAIRGPLRFDLFWGFGAEAGERAGRQKHEGRAWLLVPKGVAPEALLRR